MKLLGTAIGGLIAAIVSVNEALAASPHMKTSGLSSQPVGHFVYCKTYTNDCKMQTLSPKVPALTEERWNELKQINAFSNTSVKPYTDFQIYNEEEVWAYPNNYGDCEDYVLMKRKLLMDRGWPASSLLITVVRRPNGEGHAVLTVRTDRADFIMDNLVNEIHPWHRTPYQYLKRQSERHSGRWIDIKDTRAAQSS